MSEVLRLVRELPMTWLWGAILIDFMDNIKVLIYNVDMQKNDFYISNLWKNGVKFFSELNQFIEKFPSSTKNVLGIQIKSSMATILADLAEASECDFHDAQKKIIFNAHGRIERMKCYLRISIESGSVDKIEAGKIAKKFDDLKIEINEQFKMMLPKRNNKHEETLNKYLKEILKFITDNQKGVTFTEIRKHMERKKLILHERTLRRHVSKLFTGNLIVKQGHGNRVKYQVI